jgi:hypothetical protein
VSVEPQAVGWWHSTAPRSSRVVLVRPRAQLRLWLWAWAVWLILAAAVPPVGLVVGAVLALAHKVLGAAMFTVATISAIWMAAAYYSR